MGWRCQGIRYRGRGVGVARPASRLAGGRGQGQCTACDIDCPGTSTHRLRSSLCPSCWQAWLRWQDHRGSDLTRADWSDPDTPLRPCTLQDAADLQAYRQARRAKLDAQGKLDGLTADVTPVRDRRDPIASHAIGTMTHIHGRLGGETG